MKIKDIMQTSVLSVSEDAPIKEVARMIFSTGISGAPVVKGKKLVGIITEEDIVTHMYPKQQMNEEISDFAQIENNLRSLLSKPVSSIMNRNVIPLPEETPLLKAQSLMLTHKFSRVPVVNTNGELIGIVSQGDIFRQVLKEEMPLLEKDRFVRFMSDNYDIMIDWEQRFEQEFPSLFRIFKKEKVKNVLDIGVWGGIFSIGLAEEGLKVTALEQNDFMLELANLRRGKLSKEIKDNIKFKHTDYKDIKKDAAGLYDAALCLGNSLLYIPGQLSEIFKQISEVLKPGGIVIFQMINVDRVLNRKKRLLNFQIQKPEETYGKERLFLEFLDKKNESTSTHNLIVFDSDGGDWVFQGETALEIKHLHEKEIVNMLGEVGFTDISVAGYQGEYQGEYVPISFIKPFDSKTSDWMTVVAKKK